MSIYTTNGLVNLFNTKLSDELSDYWGAKEILESQRDLAESILPIVSNELDKLYRNVKVKNLIVQSGVSFNDATQTIPYKGASSIPHGELSGLPQNDHPQYVTVSGSLLEGNIGITNGNYITSRGSPIDHGRGFYFSQTNNKENFVIGRNTKIKFDKDNSIISGVGGTVNAWISFDSTTSPLTVKTSYNVKQIKHISSGKYMIYFNKNLESDYLVIATSNGSSLDEVNFIRAVSSFRRSDRCSLAVRDQSNKYLNAKINDLIIISIS